MTFPSPSFLRRRLRATHRWLAVVAGAYFLLMAFSGVLLNHPDWLADLDVPRAWVPGDYAYRNWNRNALRGAVEGADGVRYLYGEAGVWRVALGGEPEPAMEGFPPGAYRRDTRAMLAVDGPWPVLLAGTRGGLLARPAVGGAAVPWVVVPLPEGGEPQAVVDLLRAGPRVLAVTRSRVFRASLSWPPSFTDATPPRCDEPDQRLPLFRFLFHAHSGEAWGLPGRLAVDAAGVALAGFTGTGLWFWWRRRRRTLARGRSGRLCRLGLRWHLRLGLWCAVPLLLVGLTGLFQRPPFLVAVAGVTYSAGLHPAPRSPDPWHDLLRKALYDPTRDELVLATADGFFRGPVDGSAPLRPTGSAPPVSVMGATVLRRQPDGMVWVGSMSGLYLWDPDSGWVVDAFTGHPPRPSWGRPAVEPAVGGPVWAAGGALLAVDYFRGVLDGRGREVLLPAPPQLAAGGRISLWHLLFEIHNGRIFGFLLGGWNWVVVPLGGLVLVAEVISGVVASRRSRRSRRPAGKSGP